MFQKEVAVRIASAHGNRDYGILSVLLQTFYTIEYLFTVSESVFIPPPKVKSAVIRLTRNDRRTLPCEESFFFRVVKTAFNQRRKTLRNALRPLMWPLPEEAMLRPGDRSILDHRAEHLSPSDFIALATELSNFAQTSEKG
jgi:16S rRNA (adenine1518-N6/adenine1519-N6)-dimethyltransferase